MYDQLTVELRNEDHVSFTNFPAYAPSDVRRAASQSGSKDNQAAHLIIQGSAWAWHEAGPDLTSPCLWEHASMKFGWRVPQNTLSLVVREVCQAIMDEYVDEVLVCPSTPDGWRAIADKFFQRWNFDTAMSSAVMIWIVEQKPFYRLWHVIIGDTLPRAMH